MRQFDLYRNPSTALEVYAPYLIVLQSHYLGDLETVVVAPLVRDADRPLTQLDIAIIFDGQSLVIAVAELAAMDRSRLTRRAGDAMEQQDLLRRAIDRLFTGF